MIMANPLSYENDNSEPAVSGYKPAVLWNHEIEKIYFHLSGNQLVDPFFLSANAQNLSKIALKQQKNVRMTCEVGPTMHVKKCAMKNARAKLRAKRTS